MRTIPVLLGIFSLTFLAACAGKAGDGVHCEECDNVTELLVGTKCVPIAEIAVCGPDGHAHGDVCHCFSGQAPTTIGENQYCIQECSAGEPGDQQVEDVDAHACEAAEGAKETATAVDAFEKFDEVHLELETLYELTLPAGKEGFVHTGPATTGDWAIYLGKSDLFVGAFNAKGEELEVEMMGANEDCATIFPAIFHVLYTVQEGMGPAIILKFKASTAETKVLFFAHEAGHDHE